MIGEGTQSSNQRKHSYVRDRVEVGFFTDPSVCIGCKACEVACKEWNEVPDDGFIWSGNSYDNTGHLGASTWRHVMFLEQDRAKGNQIAGPMSLDEDPFRWVFLSDVCKHCEEAGCLEACPTGSIVFGRLDDLRARGVERVQQLQQSGYNDVQLYDPTETSVRGIHAFFLILGEPEAYGLPPKPQVPTIYLKSAWTSAFATAIASIIATLAAFAFFH